MTQNADLARVLALFPERALGIREIFLKDESFRGICEDYGLACDSLARFEALPDARSRPEIAEYRSVIAELEQEIAALLPVPAR